MTQREHTSMVVITKALEILTDFRYLKAITDAYGPDMPDDIKEAIHGLEQAKKLYSGEIKQNIQQSVVLSEVNHRFEDVTGVRKIINQ